MAIAATAIKYVPVSKDIIMKGRFFKGRPQDCENIPLFQACEKKKKNKGTPCRDCYIELHYKLKGGILYQKNN